MDVGAPDAELSRQILGVVGLVVPRAVAPLGPFFVLFLGAFAPMEDNGSWNSRNHTYSSERAEHGNYQAVGLQVAAYHPADQAESSEYPAKERCEKPDTLTGCLRWLARSLTA